MKPLVVIGASLKCSFGTSLAALNVMPAHQLMPGGAPAATIMDHKSIVNISTFGMCSSMRNPLVAAATAGALGTLTFMGCVPVTPDPWKPGVDKVLINGNPALNQSCTLMCAFGGKISITNPVQLGLCC